MGNCKSSQKEISPEMIEEMKQAAQLVYTQAAVRMQLAQKRMEAAHNDICSRLDVIEEDTAQRVDQSDKRLDALEERVRRARMPGETSAILMGEIFRLVLDMDKRTLCRDGSLSSDPLDEALEVRMCGDQQDFVLEDAHGSRLVADSKGVRMQQDHTGTHLSMVGGTSLCRLRLDTCTYLCPAHRFIGNETCVAGDDPCLWCMQV